MTGRTYAYLDLAALPAVGSALLAASPTFVWSADGRQVIWANGAGAAFFEARSMAALLERRFSEALPSTGQIVRLARSLPVGVTRLERITIASGGRLQSLAASCRRLALSDGATAVLLVFDPPRGDRATLAERAIRLAQLITAEDCVVAVLDRSGGVVATHGDFDDSGSAGSAIDELVAAVDRAPERVVKRAIRIGLDRRSAGMLRFEADGRAYHLLIAGPAERIAVEPPTPPRQDPPIVQATAAIPVTLPKAPPIETTRDEIVAPTAPEPMIAPKPSIAMVAAPAPLPLPDTSELQLQPQPVIADEQKDALDAPDLVEPTMVLEPETAAEPTAAEPVRSTGLPEHSDESADLKIAAEPLVQPVETSAPSLAAEPAPGPSDAATTASVIDEPPVVEAPPPSFEFHPPAGPVRFVFQMNGAGVFTFVSADFAAVVGPAAAALVDHRWEDVAAARGLDGDGAIAALIRRRDTWSGVTLDWPIDNSPDRVAVDLAALPAFSRDRAFEGYRGFGVIRPRDARRDPPPVRERPPVAPVPAAPPSAQPPSNVVRLTRPAGSVEGEKLSAPEQEAFRRIAVVLGAETPPAEARPPETVPPDAHRPDALLPDAPAETVAPFQPVKTPEIEPAPIATVAPEAAEAQPPPAFPPLSTMASELILERFAEAGRKIAELEAILDTATDGVAVVDSEGRIERINKSAEALFGVPTKEVTGLLFTDLLAEESRKSALDYLEGLARNGVASVLNDGREVIGRVPQGGLIPLFMTMGRVGETGKFCAVLRDITQWKNAEEELVNARRTAETASMQKSDFLAKISHEIRTPLNAIIGFSEVMMEERFGPIGTERYKEYLRDIHVSGAHLMSLLNDLLDLSKIEAGKLDLAFEAVALNDIVMECVALMQPQANRERIIIRTSLSAQVPNIIADSRSIRQIALNLLSNAVKFTLAGGQVIVSTALEERGEVTLRIRDTGIGMSERDIETALKPFRQLTTSPKSRNDGTGLGLPLTKALVEANRAAFVIDSEVGQGTLIRITFPTTRVLAG